MPTGPPATPRRDGRQGPALGLRSGARPRGLRFPGAPAAGARSLSARPGPQPHGASSRSALLRCLRPLTFSSPSSGMYEATTTQGADRHSALRVQGAHAAHPLLYLRTVTLVLHPRCSAVLGWRNRPPSSQNQKSAVEFFKINKMHSDHSDRACQSGIRPISRSSMFQLCDRARNNESLITSASFLVSST